MGAVPHLKPAPIVPSPVRPKGERGRLGWGFSKHRGNCLYDPIQLMYDLAVGETYHPIAVGHQPLCPFFVVDRLPRVRVPIHFNHELCLGTEEVDDVWTDGVLLSEVGGIHLPMTQMLPQAVLRMCQFAA